KPKIQRGLPHFAARNEVLARLSWALLSFGFGASRFGTFRAQTCGEFGRRAEYQDGTEGSTRDSSVGSRIDTVSPARHPGQQFGGTTAGAEAEMAETRTALNAHTETEPKTRRASGLDFERRFTDGKVSPFDAVEWERRTAQIGNDKGQVIFRQDNVEVPKSWSMTATNIVASKYFHGKPNTPEREGSVRQLIGRVVDTIVRCGEEGGYFSTTDSKNAFSDELAPLLVEQKVAFNSPVWFNVGVQAKPQCSACFINSVQDNMDSIMNLAKTEGMLFKWGSGTGTNFSTLRGSHESLSGGGIASGPVSFMKG